VLVKEQRACRKDPKQEKANQYTIDVASALVCGHTTPFPAYEKKVGITGKNGAYQTGQQYFMNRFVDFHEIKTKITYFWVQRYK
jgi:hypothetical protein